MSFTEYEYFVHENEGEVRVCLELFGMWKPIQTGIWIHVFTTDNTAIGKGGREGGRVRGREGGRGGWEKVGRGGREGGRVRGREGGRMRGRVREREGGKGRRERGTSPEGGREGGREGGEEEERD